MRQNENEREEEKSSTATQGRAASSFRLRNPSLNSLRLRRIFDLFDRNGDGFITLQELSRALELLGFEADFGELESMVKSHIKPGNRGLEYDDFEALHRSLGDSLFGSEYPSSASPSAPADEQNDQDLVAAFQVFDEDGDGFISAFELQKVLSKLGLQEGREMDSVHRMICSVDRNSDGQVDFSEFKIMMQSISVPSA